MKLRWMRVAVLDLQDLRELIANDDPDAAARVAARILEVADKLIAQPGLGRRGRVPGTREFLVSGTPYLLVYRTRGDFIEMLRVLHGKRQWPPSS